MLEVGNWNDVQLCSRSRRINREYEKSLLFHNFLIKRKHKDDGENQEGHRVAFQGKTTFVSALNCVIRMNDKCKIKIYKVGTHSVVFPFYVVSGRIISYCNTYLEHSSMTLYHHGLSFVPQACCQRKMFVEWKRNKLSWFTTSLENKHPEGHRPYVKVKQHVWYPIS